MGDSAESQSLGCYPFSQATRLALAASRARVLSHGIPLTHLSIQPGEQDPRSSVRTLSNSNLLSFPVNHRKPGPGPQRGKRGLGWGQAGVIGGARQLPWLETGPRCCVSTSPEEESYLGRLNESV